MRTLVSLISLALLAPAALAAPGRSATARAAPAAQPRTPQPALPPPAPLQLAPIDRGAVPEPCRPLAQQAVQPGAAALSARIALASCMVERAVAPIALCDCGESIAAIDDAIAPALALLDDVVGAAGPATQMVAEHTEGQIYRQLAARLTATLPALAAGVSDDERALRDMRKQTLEAQLAPWHEAAMAAFQHVVELGKAHPDLARSPAVASAVRDSEQQLAAEIAAR
jgi:hypothetical protein